MPWGIMQPALRPPPELQSPCIVFAVLQSAHGLQQPGADVQVDHSESLL